jgi:ABC-type multidrug transport system fused ATPase/permease subunit
LNSIRKIFAVLSTRQKREIVILQVLVMIVSLVELMGVASIAPFMAVATNPLVIHTNKFLNAAYSYGKFSSDMGFLQALGLLVLFILFAGNGLIFISTWFLTSFGASLGRTISVGLYRNYLHRSYLFHTKHNSSVLSKNIFHEVLRFTNNVVIQFLTLNSKIFTIIFITIGLAFLSPLLTFMAAGILGGSYLFIYILTKKKLQENGDEMSALLGGSFRVVSEGLGGIKDVKLHGKEDVYSGIFDGMMQKYTHLSIFNTLIPLVPRYALEVLTFGSVIGSFIYYASQGKTVAEFLPTLSIFAVAGLKLMPALQQVFASLTTIRSSFNSLRIVTDDLAGLGAESDFPETHPKPSTLFADFSHLALKNISFRYPGSEKWVIRDLSFEIRKNTTTAFVGLSGSGKSTIVDLLSGLLVPASGSVEIGDRVLNKENVRDWQSQIGYVPQSVYLIDGSFTENIAFGEDIKSIDMKRVTQAASLASIDSFISETVHGYSTRVGERGVQLSGGQRQRIGIARALYRNPALLIFDEATSALDSLTESEIMQSIENLSGIKTIILIAHRLTTVKSSHLIYLMNNGQIEAKGTYQELLEQSALFQDMARS